MDQAGNGIIYITHILLARTRSYDSILPARDTAKCSLAIFPARKENGNSPVASAKPIFHVHCWLKPLVLGTLTTHLQASPVQLQPQPVQFHPVQNHYLPCPIPTVKSDYVWMPGPRQSTSPGLEHFSFGIMRSTLLTCVLEEDLSPLSFSLLLCLYQSGSYQFVLGGFFFFF